MKLRNDASFEECLARLDEIVQMLDRGDAPLEKGLALFEEGVGLVRACQDMLAGAEQRVLRFSRDEEGPVTLTPFPDEGEAR
ncbi:MAG: exodeoxyribonuclease VII small subunit [Candidatus Eiseniibacteriota bacterium]